MAHPLLKKYQAIISQAIDKWIEQLPGKGPLQEGLKYTLSSGGKRLRPVAVLMVADALRGDLQSCSAILPAALAVEFFHTASLVADDLPCMDDDDERRCKPSVHKVYGESLALLTSYALIAAGFQAIAESSKEISASNFPWASRGAFLGVLAFENAAFNTGLLGATGGQLLDLFPPDLSESTLREVVQKKTVSLFEVAFVFGWLFGGGEVLLLPDIKAAAAHFGMAFQIADDLGDIEQDFNNGRKVNFAAVFGIDSAKNMLQEELSAYRKVLAKLNIDSSALLALADDLGY